MKFLPLKHYAEEYGIPIGTLINHCQVGELRSIKVGTGKTRNRYRLPQEWWDQFIEQQEKAALRPTERFLPVPDDEVEFVRRQLAILRENYSPPGRRRKRTR